jgi:hypothetical protein
VSLVSYLSSFRFCCVVLCFFIFVSFVVLCYTGLCLCLCLHLSLCLVFVLYCSVLPCLLLSRHLLCFRIVSYHDFLAFSCRVFVLCCVIVMSGLVVVCGLICWYRVWYCLVVSYRSLYCVAFYVVLCCLLVFIRLSFYLTLRPFEWFSFSLIFWWPLPAPPPPPLERKSEACSIMDLTATWRYASHLPFEQSQTIRLTDWKSDGNQRD